MKTLRKFLVVSTLLLGINQLYAQLPIDVTPPKNGNGNVSFTYEWDGYWQSISCDNFEDELSGTVNCVFVVHFMNNLPVFANEHLYGTVKSKETDEEFNLMEKDKIEFSGFAYSIVHWHFNLIGNEGTHYVGTMTWNAQTGDMWFDKLICIGK